MEPRNPVSAYLRAEVEQIVEAWEAEVSKRLPQLARLDSAARRDQLSAFLDGLASWVEGDEESGRRGFDALVQGHALQRLGHGIDLETLTSEYQILRNVILRHLLAVESTRHVRLALVRLADGLDFAVNDAVRRYSLVREQIRERFVGILGHDLKNPVHAVEIAARQIASVACSEPNHGRLGALIQHTAERMMRMIGDVVDFAHSHLGQGIPVRPVRCDLAEICHDVVRELRLGYPDRDLRVEVAGDTTGAWDRDRTYQVVENLVGNALQHGADPITIAACEAPDRRAVILRVANRGRPIPEEDQPRLFDPFRTGHANAPRARSNLGLGLYIVQQIVIAHGATIEVASDERATVFEIRWPRVPVTGAPSARARDDA